MAGVLCLGGGLFTRNPTYSYIGSGLATVSALGLIAGTSHLRKQGLSPTEVQAMIEQHNHTVSVDSR